MPDLMINPTPTSPPSGTGNTHAITQGDAPGRLDENTGTTGGSATEAPFAAVLKSQVDKKTAASGAVDHAGPPLLAVRADAETKPDDIDLSALFQSMGASTPAMSAAPAAAPAATNPATPGNKENQVSGIQSAAAPLTTQLVAALPAALPSVPPEASALPVALPSAPSEASALPVALAETSALPVAPPAALPSTPRLAFDTKSPRKQGSENQNEAFPSGAHSRPGEAAKIPGKIALDPAINADVGRRNADINKPEVAANDFHAILDRTLATTPGASSLAPGSTASPRLHIETPLGRSGWHEEVGQKLTWMVGNNRQQADLVLNPPQLGRIEVSLTMNGDQATAIFTSSNPAVREALENSLHRLREVLADAGVSLGQTQVGSESPNRSSSGNEPDIGRNQGMRYASTIPLPGAEAVARTGTGVGRGMIDVFA